MDPWDITTTDYHSSCDFAGLGDLLHELQDSRLTIFFIHE